MAIDEQNYKGAINEVGLPGSAALRQFLESYLRRAARKQEPERPMLNRISEYISVIRHQNVPSLTIAHGVLDIISQPSAEVVKAVEIECRMTPPGEFLKGLRAYVQRIREGG